MKKSRRTGASKIIRAGHDQGDRWGLLARRSGSVFPQVKEYEINLTEQQDELR